MGEVKIAQCDKRKEKEKRNLNEIFERIEKSRADADADADADAW